MRRGLLPAAVALLALSACGSSGTNNKQAPPGPAPTLRPTQGQLSSALVSAGDLALSSDWIPGQPTSGASTTDSGSDNTVTCPGVGNVEDNQIAGDPTAGLTFTNSTNQDTVEEDLEATPSAADAQTEYAKGIALLAKCKTVTIEGATFAVKALTVPVLGDAQAAYEFTGTVGGKTVSVATGICILGPTEISVSVFGSNATDIGLAVPALEKSVAKFRTTVG